MSKQDSKEEGTHTVCRGRGPRENIKPEGIFDDSLKITGSQL